MIKRCHSAKQVAGSEVETGTGWVDGSWNGVPTVDPNRGEIGNHPCISIALDRLYPLPDGPLIRAQNPSCLPMHDEPHDVPCIPDRDPYMTCSMMTRATTRPLGFGGIKSQLVVSDLG